MATLALIADAQAELISGGRGIDLVFARVNVRAYGRNSAFILGDVEKGGKVIQSNEVSVRISA